LSLIRIADPDPIRPRHVALIVLVGLTLAGSGLLSSSGRPTELPDGAREWREDSAFRALVEMLNLNYAEPTPHLTDIKSVVFGLGVAVAVLCAGIAFASRPVGADTVEESDTVIADPASTVPTEALATKRHLHPLLAAQVLMLAYMAWSFASMSWSAAPDIAFYGSVELALGVLWALVLAYGISRAAARFGTYALVGVGAVTAAIVVAYVYERNSTLRASYPIGNATFLAACLVPVLLLAASILVAQVRDFGNPRRVRRVLIVLACLGVGYVTAWAFALADSRGARVGLAAGFLALFFFAWAKRGKIGVLLLALVLGGVGGGWVARGATAPSTTGRDASLRVRLYGWGYALDLIGQRRLLGHGQGGYACKADALASGADVLNDPESLSAWIDHAHNEWLEVWTDLGSVGLVLVVGALGFTLLAGAAAVRAVPTVPMRWVLIGLLASLTALVVEEAAEVGLRFPGLPPVYYTIIGLIWAFCTPTAPVSVARWRRSGAVRAAGLGVAVLLGGGAAYFSARDFQAARAQYEIRGALERLEWERAEDLAYTAAAYRLSPQRRLMALGEACATYVHIAQVFKVNGLRRAETALEADPRDERLLGLAQQDLQLAEVSCHAGTELLKGLVRRAPDFYNSHWLQYGLQRVRADIARARGEPAKAHTYDRDAADALARELARRPYDINLAATYVEARGLAAGPEEQWADVCVEICEILARPLRYNRIQPLYDDTVARLVSVPDFRAVFLPLYERAIATPVASDPAQWESPWAPEMLRLAALAWSKAGDEPLAVAALERACELYLAVKPRFALGCAVCFAELAERRLINNVLDPGPAISAARRALELAPPSNEGRQLVQGVTLALSTMQLAAGDEPAARKTLQEVAPQNADVVVNQALSARYTQLVSALMRNGGELHMDELRRWTMRAVELDEANETAWRHRADIAFRDHDDAECVRCLREARRRGAADDFIFQFVDIALRERPTSRPLLEYSRELGAELQSASQPGREGASQ
jgi:O-antigen ligase